jgi:N-sulfoglucosamine sulfohydrolase
MIKVRIFMGVGKRLFAQALELGFAFSFALHAADRPNVVLIIADDISPDFSCFDGPVKTPAIDGLAAGGVLFENAYVTASSCSPSRCSIITGRYPHNTGAPELHMVLPEGQFMFPKALKDAGYYSVMSGKWHMGEATRPAFDVVDDAHYPEEPTGAANWVQHLQERPMNKPFFMWFAAFDAHRPWEADTEETPHDASKIVVPAGVPDTPIARADMASYYDEVRRFDRYVGGVVEELKTQGVYENTAIILLGDNGRPFPRSKTSLYDDGMKTPLIVHWPEGKFKVGSRIQSLVSAIDIAPAILEVAGLSVAPQVQGISFLPICREPEVQTREILFGERNWHTQRSCGRMVRCGDYVYMRDFVPGSYSFQMVDSETASYVELLRLKEEGKLRPEEAEAFSTKRARERLFDVSKDPKQLNNLAGNPEMNGTMERMRAMLDTWQERTGDSIPAIEDMTPDRHDRETYERLFPGMRPPEGVVAGQEAGATEINDAGPIR